MSGANNPPSKVQLKIKVIEFLEIAYKSDGEITANLKDDSINLNWKVLTQPQQTVVFLYGLERCQNHMSAINCSRCFKRFIDCVDSTRY